MTALSFGITYIAVRAAMAAAGVYFARKRHYFHAYPASDTEILEDNGFSFFSHLDTVCSSTDNRAEKNTLLIALLRLASVFEQYCDSHLTPL